jgi:hypothetical protein
MPIMSDAKWIGRVPPGHVNSLDGSLSLGLQKKNSVALSMAEAEYITAGSCCAQLLLMCTTTFGLQDCLQPF